MKKLITICAFVFAATLVKAQTDTSRIVFDYYPESNVYYNTKAHSYWYLDAVSQKWQNGLELPARYSLTDKSKKTKLYSDSPDIWKKNASHVKMFGNKSTPAKRDQ